MESVSSDVLLAFGEARWMECSDSEPTCAFAGKRKSDEGTCLSFIPHSGCEGKQEHLVWVFLI